MSDLLSISASVVGLVQAVKSLYGLIDSIKEAPETLVRAGDDLKYTESVLKDLRQYSEASKQQPQAIQDLIDQKSALSSTLSRFKKLCHDFDKTLASCVRRSSESSKLTSLKKGSIEMFQAEVSRARKVISMRVGVITLVEAEKNAAAIQDFQRKNETIMANIIQQLEKLDTPMTGLRKLAGESSDVVEKALRENEAALKDQEVALKEQLLLCRENRAAAAAKSLEQANQEFGNTQFEGSSQIFQGMDLDKVRVFEQKFGDTDFGNSTRNAQGAVGGAIIEGLLTGSAAATKPGRFTGPGKRVGSSVATLDGSRSGSAPGKK